LAHSPQVLSEEDEKTLREKWPKAARTKLEQKWSFGGIIASLSKSKHGTPLEVIDLLTHTYRMSSHIAHGDEMGINLIRERKSRSPKEENDVSIAHYLRLMSDGLNYCLLTAIYTCSYLKIDPQFFLELGKIQQKHGTRIKEYHMVPFTDKIYDRFR